MYSLLYKACLSSAIHLHVVSKRNKISIFYATEERARSSGNNLGGGANICTRAFTQPSVNAPHCLSKVWRVYCVLFIDPGGEVLL